MAELPTGSLSYGDWGTRLRAWRCRLFGVTDVRRWSDAGAYGDWEERTRLIAEMIPAGARVIEFGAGRRLLERHLRRRSLYTPSDLSNRGEGTIVLDLNRKPLPQLDGEFDVAVLAGVVEYVQSVPSLLSWLSRQVPTVIMSYSCAARPPRSLRRILESYRRAGSGWVNNYSEAELVQIAARAQYRQEETITWHTPDGDERIFKFCRLRRS